MLYFHDSKSEFSFPIVQRATDDQHTNTQITKNEFHSTHPTIYVIKYLSWGFDSIVSTVTTVTAGRLSITRCLRKGTGKFFFS